MINYSIRDDGLVFRVHVVPRSSRSQVVGEHNGSLRLKVAAPPVEGAANEEIVRVLAKAFKVSRISVTIQSGHTARLKQVKVNGSPEALIETLKNLAA